MNIITTSSMITDKQDQGDSRRLYCTTTIVYIILSVLLLNVLQLIKNRPKTGSVTVHSRRSLTL